jgi:hypothetical protein
LANRPEEPKVRGIHLTVDEDSEEEFLDWIEAQAEKYKPITSADVRHYWQRKYFRSLSRVSVDSFIICHCDDLTETKSTPQEDSRLAVPCAFLDETTH